MKVLKLSVSSMIYDSRIQKEALTLSKAGHDVTIAYIEDQEFYYGLPDPEKAYRDYLSNMEGTNTIRMFLVSRTWKFLPKFINKFFQAIELFCKMTWVVIAKKYDVYHSHDLTPGIFALIGKYFRNAKIVYDAHELEVAVTGTNRFSARIKRVYESLLMKSASISITVNQYIADMMEQNYGKPVEVIANMPNYIEPEMLESSHIREGVMDGQKVILYVGNVNPVRGIDKVALSLKYLPDNFIYLIMGTGRVQEYKKFLNALMARNGIESDRVRFIGPFPSDKVVSYLSGADVSVMMYQANTDNSVVNAPNKFYQSIMARVPVVASANKSFPKLIHENGVGTVGEVALATDPEAIARSIQSVVESIDYDNMKANANTLSKRYSWENEASKLVKMYESINL